MSSAPAPGPRDAEPSPENAPRPRIVFDDPLDRPSSDDTDQGWGERPATGGGADDLARFLDEKPPHHV
ncbi:hypothetical protein ABT354_16285 [Streptomyces sp. NPDC000594]|uniref:hypothetical protein n=1 Tax=Streptomyces sp. NPDC000594 TaxID=3154261 RepID=UPI003334156A